MQNCIGAKPHLVFQGEDSLFRTRQDTNSWGFVGQLLWINQFRTWKFKVL